MSQAFGRYQLLDLIGKGGMAEVYRARLEVPAGAEKLLVIKRILPSFSEDPEFLRLFVNEARITLPLTHGNITTVFDFGEVSGQYYLAMEYIHGQNLADILERCRETGRQPPVPTVLFIASEVAKGLAYAHGTTATDRPAIVHLDVSPQNILVSYEGAVKLTDFGIARAREKAAPEQRVVRGKASYLAPEQVESGSIDARTDVYALGCVMYEMLTGVRPQEGATDEEVLESIRVTDPVPPSLRRKELAELDSLVMKALARDPEQRYPRAADFQVALQQALFARAPGYGAPDLAGWMRETFAWEIAQEKGDPGVRDRLLFQLAKAQVRPDGGGTTGELLALPTLPLLPEEKRRRRWPVFAMAAAALLAGAGIAFALMRQSPPPTPVTTAAPVAAGKGQLSLNSWPSAEVFLDGQRLSGTTPIIRREVESGRHQVRFVQPEQDLEKVVDVDVQPGEERAVVVKLSH